jgi:hypothetical protein
MHQNPSTCLPISGIRSPAPDLHAAYEVAAAAERSRHDRAVGYRLYFLADGRFGSVDVPTDPMSFLVVGRHAMCDLVLDLDPTIALRHLLVRAARLDDGCLRLSILDLHTHIGFETSSGLSSRSISATGPIALRVGAYAIIALPSGDALPEKLPEPACAAALVQPKHHPYRDAASPPSSLTLLPPAMELGTSAAGHATFTVTLFGAHGSASVNLSALDLELGVLVGRAPKCAAALRYVLNDGISRVHVLLRRRVAYDLVSTQGTYVHARRIRATTFDDETSEIRLGSVSPVMMRIAPSA